MRPLKIECANPNWRILLKKNLQEGIEADVSELDYAADWQFCEILAISHSMTLRLDTKNKIGKFRKCGTAHGSKEGIIALPSPGQG